MIFCANGIRTHGKATIYFSDAASNTP
jgi:hypothetical protein